MAAKATKCLITADLASAIRTMANALGVKMPKGRMAFLCRECQRPVKPAYSAEGKLAHHFEHLKRNPRCSLSGG
jgi:hypothetical protein